MSFKESLNRRGLTITALAQMASVSRAHLSLVFQNRPGRGGHVRRKVAPYLTEYELRLLGWDRFGRMINPSPSREVVIVPRETCLTSNV